MFEMTKLVRIVLGAGPCVRFTRVQVPDPGCEKLEELCCGIFAGFGENRRNGVSVPKG